MTAIPGFAFSGYVLSRAVFQRGLALVYLIAFLAALNQFKPLLGEKGLLPAPAFMARADFRDAPSLFSVFPKDSAFTLGGAACMPPSPRR